MRVRPTPYTGSVVRHASAPIATQEASLADQKVDRFPVDQLDSVEHSFLSNTEPPVSTFNERSGLNDDDTFEQHWTVEYWRSYTQYYYSEGPGAQHLSESERTRQYLQKAAGAVRLEAAGARTATDAAYWAYHLFRMGVFASFSALGVAVAAVRNGFLSRGSVKIASEVPVDQMGSFVMNLTSEALHSFKADLRLVNEGVYRLPWDMTTPSHRQYNPLWVAGHVGDIMQEATSIVGRASRSEGPGKTEHGSELPFLQSSMYPRYYQNDFHFQSDGWFSSRSAEVYDGLTEGAFMGRQDAMQRTALIPIARHFPSSKGEGLRMLEVGAGTGRFATFLRDNYPHAHLTVSDLSPFYLQKANESLKYWQEKSPAAKAAAGEAKLLQCAAEEIPLPDASQDVVYSVYMFHEMPRPAQKRALREFTRVLKPGGLLVITDSTQLGDRPEMDSEIEVFTSFNEPHFSAYLRFDFGSEFQAVGLQPALKCMQSSTKSLSAIKPLQ